MKRFSFHTIIPTLVLGVAMQTIAQESTLEEVNVTGRAQQYYLQKSTELGSKLDLSILELPQSVQVLPAQLIIDQAARDITDLYRSIAGVSEFSYSGVTFRGFRDSGNVFYDGVRGDPYSGFSVPQLFNVERVEILKGPAAALYGGGEPGGMINYVTKQASFEPSTELALTGGNFSLYGGSVDTTGPMTDTVAYRIGAFYEKQDSFRNNAEEENLEFAGGLLFQLSDKSTLNASVDYVDQSLPGHRLRGVLVNDAGDFIVDRSYNTNEAVDFQNLEALILQTQLRHHFTNDFEMRGTLRYLDNEREQGYHEPRGWVDVNGDGEANIQDATVRREYRDQFRANKEYSLTLDFIRRFDVAGLEHQFLFGADYHDVDTEYSYLRARYEADNVRDLNIFTLNYGESDPSSYNLTDLNRDGTQLTRYGLYLQTHTQFNEQWSLMLGFRYSDFEDVNKSIAFRFSDDHVSPRFGLTYSPIPNAAIYLNYSESFKATSLGNQGRAEEFGFLNPEKGHQWELGWKQEWLEGRLLSTVAAYQIVKQDVAVTNPLEGQPGQPDVINLGEVDSEGIEFTVVGDLTENWTLTANYAYNDTRVVKGGDLRNSFADGSRFVNSPEHQAGIWTRYDFRAIDSSIAFGADFVDEQFGFSGTQRVQPYTTFDASWTSSWNRISLQINILNVFDKEYAVSGFLERTGHFPGSPREIIAQLRYQL
ncbi:MAG: TonB-dependent siderophore receptor [Pseudomonadota bacterium]